jgi:hypothetical protein
MKLLRLPRKATSNLLLVINITNDNLICDLIQVSPDNTTEEAPAAKKSKGAAKYTVEPDILVKINEDKLNQKKWSELKTAAYATKLDFTNAAEEAFRCQCCQEIVFQPVTPPCCHSQCKTCLKRALRTEWRR